MGALSRHVGENMKLVLFEYRCKSCGEIFKAPQVSSHAYGEFLLRKKNSSSLRYLDAINSSVYSDVARDIKLTPETSGLTEVQQADVLQAIFGVVACDPDADGQPFHMGLMPRCPHCKDRDALSWNITDPIEFVETEVPPVTFFVWHGLTPRERKTKILDSVRNFLPKMRVA